MRTALSSLSLLEPGSLPEALSMLSDAPGATPLAGGTDLYVALNFGTLRDTRFLDLSRIGCLREIRLRDDVLSIGALSTYTDILRSPVVADRIPILASAAREIGGVQIQNRGTLGGNVANGSPAGDTLPVLAAADAVVVLESAGGARRVPFGAFYTGYRQSVRRADELIVAIEIPAIDGRQWFRKVGTRAAQAISKVVMAAIRSSPPRIALGSVAPTVVRLPLTEASLAASGSIEEARRVLAREIHPIDDLRSTAAYRRRVAENLLAQFWRETS